MVEDPKKQELLDELVALSNIDPNEYSRYDMTMGLIKWLKKILLSFQNEQWSTREIILINAARAATMDLYGFYLEIACLREMDKIVERMKLEKELSKE